MRFASSTRPALTPLGARLLSISESKLANLESPYHSRDDASALRKGVVVREAVRSAWRTVSGGSVSADLNDWSNNAAMGLSVVSEADEEDEEGTLGARGEVRWFENLVSSFGDEDYVPEADLGPHEWVESSVASAFDDIEYDDEGMEAFTFMSTSPSVSPSHIHSHATLPFDVDDEAIVTVSPVFDDLSDEEDEEAVYDGDDEDAVVQWAVSSHAQPVKNTLHLSISDHHPSPTIIAIDSSSPPSPFSSAEFVSDEYDSELLLPPPLVHSGSTSSTPSTSDDEECLTPPSASAPALNEQEDEDSDGEELFVNGEVTAKPAWSDIRLEDRLQALALAQRF